MAGNSMQLNKNLRAKFIPTATTPSLKGLRHGFAELLTFDSGNMRVICSWKSFYDG